MLDQKAVFNLLQNEGVDFITGVPDSLLNEFCSYAANELPSESHVIAANEGNAIALAAGYHLATGSIPLVYMQNSGIGNALNPLLSLTNKEVYAIPLILLIGWRGAPGTNDHVQHKKQGELTPVLLDSLRIPFKIMDSDDDSAFDLLKWAVGKARDESGPVALIAKKGVFEKGKKKESDSEHMNYEMSRESAIDYLIKSLPEDTIYVATTGRATRELYDLRTLHGDGHERDFLNVGAMGHTSSIAAGMAISKKDRFVVCLDGDASAIMHLGALPIIGKIGPKNFLHVILNNSAHESVGGQPSAGSHANLTAIAENTGYKTVRKPVKTKQELKEAINILLEGEGPRFIDIRIKKGIRDDLGPLKASISELKDIFMNFI